MQLYDERRRNPRAWFRAHRCMTIQQQKALNAICRVGKKFIRPKVSELSYEGILKVVTSNMLYLIDRNGNKTLEMRRSR